MATPPTFPDLKAMAAEHGHAIAGLARDLDAEAARLEAAARGFRAAAVALRGEQARAPLALAPATRRQPKPKPKADPRGADVTEAQVRDYVVAHPTKALSVIEIARALKSSRPRIKPHLDRLIDRGVVEAIGRTQGRRYRYVPVDPTKGPKSRPAGPQEPRGAGRATGTPVAGTGRTASGKRPQPPAPTRRAA